MQMMLDNLEKLCAKNKRELNALKNKDEETSNNSGFTEEEEQRFQLRDEEQELEVQDYLEKQNNYLYYGKG